MFLFCCLILKFIGISGEISLIWSSLVEYVLEVEVVGNLVFSSEEMWGKGKELEF